MDENDDIIDKICSGTFPLVTLGIRAGNTLPPAGESYEFYQSYPAFQAWSRETRTRLLAMIQSLAQGHGRSIQGTYGLKLRCSGFLKISHLLE